MYSALFCVLAACVADNKTHPGHAAYDGGPTPLACVPNLDGQIDSAELKAATGVPVKYLVSPQGKTRTVDVVGAVDSTGRRVWNMGIDLADDQMITVTATALDGKWYAGSFPTGQFVTPSDAAGALEAIYSADANAIYLLGIASKDAATKTLLVYQTPISLFEFPLKVGKTWVSKGTVMNGMLNGNPWTQEDTYEVTDDATGDLILKDVTFQQAHRIRTKVTIAPSAGKTVVREQVSWVFECFGEVARATSQDNETAADFTTAAEIRRFGF